MLLEISARELDQICGGWSPSYEPHAVPLNLVVYPGDPGWKHLNA